MKSLRIDRGDESIRPKRSALTIVVVVAMLLAAAIGFVLTRRSSVPAVEVAIAQSVAESGGGGDAVLNATGYVTARRQATVSSKVTGRVVEILVEEGMPVREGQLLARLDAAVPEAELRLAQARVEANRRALEETEVRIREAQLELRRAEALARQEIASEADADRARAEVDALQARLDAQRADLAVSRRQAELSRQYRDDTDIVAPFDGIVISKNAQAGEMISPMSAGGGFTRTGICTIVDMDSLEIEVDVNEAYINRVSAGQPVRATLDAYPAWQIPAHVIAVVPAADRQKATVRVRIGLDVKDPRILPDMGARVAFMEDETASSAAEAGVAIPRAAVTRDGEQDIVYVFDGERAERRAVRVAGTSGDTSRVIAGLRAGERVILSPSEEITDGARVRLAEESAE